MNSRQQTILQMVIDQGQVSVTDLAKATGVSEVTIRQDLNTLEKLSYLRFIENGSSNALLARTLGEQKKNVTIITVSSYIAHLLKDAPCEVILLGGVYQKKSESMVGPLTRQCIQQVHFSKAFIGIDGWQPETGFTGRDMMRTDVVNAVLEKECEAIVLTDSSKFGAVHSYSIGPVERFNRVITDSKIRASDLMHLEHSKLTVHVVDI